MKASNNVYIYLQSYLILVLTTLVYGCATPYGARGYMGGYESTELPAKLTRVVFSGNGYIEGIQTDQYVLKRACEITLERNHTHFKMYGSIFQSLDESQLDSPIMTSFWGKPYSYVYIRTYPTEQTNSINAQSLLRALPSLELQDET